MHALAFLAVATTIVVGGGEDAAATVADGGACGNGRVIPDDRELELFHTVTDHGAWRGATFESTDEVLRFRGEVVMAADETVYVEALARVASRRACACSRSAGMGISAREILRAGAAQYVVLEPNRGVFDAALGLALETAASASPFLGFWEENARSSAARGRTRTMLVTEAVRAPAGGAAAVPVPDRAALDRDLRAAAPELATRGEWQALPAAPRRRRGRRERASLIIDGAVVMDTQEAAYMVDLAGNLAGAASVEEHVIVEANAAVLRALLASDLGARSGVKALLGFWQEVVPLLRAESFDAVFFDPFPNDLERLGGACAHQRGFMAEAFRVLRPGGVFVYMSGSSDEASVEADTAAAPRRGLPPRRRRHHRRDAPWSTTCAPSTRTAPTSTIPCS
ncbi:protein-arginine N5-methyltransferase [Aureococcus anophagefferens]|uniref:Protein-arginine N5-methyltransferase n=1 Tax=Aureococcus anophagefferens TaxID=44056 RepID=A0ABR1FW93_AURAN